MLSAGSRLFGCSRLLSASQSKAVVASTSCRSLHLIRQEKSVDLPEELTIQEHLEAHEKGLMSQGTPQFDMTEGAPTVDEHTVAVTFTGLDGTQYRVPGRVGQSLLDVAREHKMGFDGTCGGKLSCNECHVVVSNEFYSQFIEPSETEKALLEPAEDVSGSSRLACQLVLTKDMDGINVAAPNAQPFYIP